MSSFGEDLRAERLSRGIALEHITEVTKISQRHLIALEEDKFRVLPGGILSKGIVRGYVGAVGLDQRDWTDRFLKASSDSGSRLEVERDWASFAENVGRSRIRQHELAALRLRWLGAIVLLLLVAVSVFFTVRYFGVRAGWWSSLLPVHAFTARAHSVVAHIAAWFQ
ncbi:MAG TPA: helix-turn-helix transcriptional regulator [Terracidiphilus sp.]|nr:helix-turn-helix transcriptional regulator [Terracidiphilus sp.]